jgi:hypothetical protein
MRGRVTNGEELTGVTQAQMPPRAQAASIPSRTSVTVSGRPTTPDLYTPRQAASSGFYFSDNNLPLSRTGSEFDMELQNREKEQALKMMEEALEIMNVGATLPPDSTRRVKRGAQCTCTSQ